MFEAEADQPLEVGRPSELGIISNLSLWSSSDSTVSTQVLDRVLGPVGAVGASLVDSSRSASRGDSLVPVGADCSGSFVPGALTDVGGPGWWSSGGCVGVLAISSSSLLSLSLLDLFSVVT
jgi:hypothetical protein